MEFSNIGLHCSISNCHQHDFLPFQCDACQQTFCRDHRGYSDHHCTKIPMGEEVIKCPVCSKGITIQPNIDRNITISAHLDSSDCKKADTSHCPKCQVRLTNTNSVLCNRCKQKVCITHRYSDQHECIHPLERKVAAAGFICPRCQSHFSKSADLIQHMRRDHLSK